jgi:hypothetical protein
LSSIKEVGINLLCARFAFEMKAIISADMVTDRQTDVQTSVSLEEPWLSSL